MKINAAWVKRLLKCVLDGEKASGELSVVFVEDDEIAALNEAYRKRKGPTDVLSFPAEMSDGATPIIGDIVLSTETAIRQAKALGHTPKEEVAFLLIHGALHLLGYDHHRSHERKKMFLRQDFYLRTMKKSN